MSNIVTNFVNHFQWAVIRLATLQVKRDAPGRLLFATVTLLSPDRPPTSKMIGVDRHNLGKSGMTVFFRRTILNAQAAVDWYRSLEENPLTPIPFRTEDIETNLDGIPIATSDLVDDPLWPNLGLPMSEGLFSQSSKSGDPAPFIGNSPSRVHRRFGNADGFETLLANQTTMAFIARRLHINLKDYPEYLGSAALVVPDPIIKQVDNFLIPASEGRGERIFYRFVPKGGQSLEGLRITMFDEQANLLSGFDSRDIPADGILEVENKICLGSYGYVVTHPIQGVLLYHPPASFLRSISFNVGIVNQVRKVSVPTGESPSSPTTEYTVNRTSRDQGSVVGEEPIVQNANSRVYGAARQREKAIDAQRYDQRWFGSGAREEAMEFIRARVGRARSRIMVADPYFGVLQVPQYLLAITSDRIKVDILTSRLAFESEFFSGDESQSIPDPKAITLIEKLRRFNNEIERVKQEGNVDVQVMVLPGKSPMLHDRFLVVDDNVWFLGNSLNTLGDRSSMIIKLPNPDEVLEKLEDMLKRADDFDTYRQRRVKAAEAAK